MSEKETDRIDRRIVASVRAAAQGNAPPVPQAPRELGCGEAVHDWVVDGKLASGGFGAVYATHHRHTGVRGALKLLHHHLAAAADMLARFDREVEVVRRLEHPNIVRLLDAGVAMDGRPYLCTELIDGEDLHHVLLGRGRLSPPELLEVLDPTCDAVAFANERGIVHRDIKASNVMACRDASGREFGRVVLLDFGIAKLLDDLGPDLTATAHPIGTPTCMAPEQIRARRVDARTDVYALGVMMYHLLTGERAFYDSSPTLTQYLHLHAKRPRPSTVVPLASRFDDIITRAMALDPADRYSGARALLADYRAAVRATTSFPSHHDTGVLAILVTVATRGPVGPAELDPALLGALESAMPDIERSLGLAGFTLAVDFGSSAVFVARVAPAAAVEAALTTWQRLCAAPRHPRLRIGLCIHAGELSYTGGELQTSALVRPSTWDVPDALEGVWVTQAIEPTARGGRRLA
jgi:hypothetical protein